MKNFWRTLKEKGEPIMVLAPMADVTDAAFRRVIAKYGRPDVVWTEFVSADGLIRANPEGKKKLLLDLLYTEAERPIVAQLFSGNPEYMYEAAKLVRELGFDGLDINMGCPDKGIEGQGAGAAMIKNPARAREVLRAAMEGVADGGTPIPVSVKTRLGYNKDELETWLPELLAEKPALITIHARTRKEMSKVPARWERVKRAVEIRNELKSETLIFGNGDLVDIADAKKKVTESGADGAMLGRAIFGNPWLFANLARTEHGSQIERPVAILEKNTNQNLQSTSINNIENASQSLNKAEQSEWDASDASPKIAMGYIPTITEKLRVLVEHTKLFEELLGDIKNFAIMKKHFKAYVTGFDGAGDLRLKLMESENADQVDAVVDNFLKNFPTTQNLA